MECGDEGASSGMDILQEIRGVSWLRGYHNTLVCQIMNEASMGLRTVRASPPKRLTGLRDLG